MVFSRTLCFAIVGADEALCVQRVGAQRRRALGLRPVPTSLSRPFGIDPLRLRACGAARCACLQGTVLRTLPAAHGLAPLDTAEPACAGSARPAPRCGERGAGEHAGACGGRLCKCVPSSTLAVPAHHVTKDGSRHPRPASPWNFHATPQGRRRKVRRGRSRLSSGG